MKTGNSEVEKPLNVEDFDLHSMNPCRIWLRYTGVPRKEFVIPVMEAALDCITEEMVMNLEEITFESVVSSWQAVVSFQVQDQALRTMQKLHIECCNGCHLDTCAPLALPQEAILRILDRFFACGSGLRPSFYTFFLQKYQLWMGCAHKVLELPIDECASK